jgi:hypothetical protein
MLQQQNEKENRVIETVDEDENVWKIVMYPLNNKTNRFQLSFCFNEKEFFLTKLQSNRYADDLWDLLSKIRKGKTKTTQSNFDMFRQAQNPIKTEETKDEQQAIN